MAKYITSDQVCEMFGITKVTLWRWEVKTQWASHSLLLHYHQLVVALNAT